jgi:hypothetical protein
MAEANPADSVRSSGASPKLVAVSEEPTKRPRPGLQQPQRSGVPRRAFRLVVALLALAFVGLLAQTWHVQNQAEQIGLLIGQVEGLEVQLSAANTQIATYDMQRSLVQSSVSRIFEQLVELQELVQLDPIATAPPSPPASQ